MAMGIPPALLGQAGSPGPQAPNPAGPQAAPPGAPPMPPPPQAPVLGASPQPSPYSDLSVSMPPHWQLVDVASRNIQAAIQTGGFYQQPEVYAAIKEIYNNLVRLISADSSNREPSSVETSRSAPGENDMASASNEPDLSPVDSTPEDSAS